MVRGLGLGVGSLATAFKRLASSPQLWPYAALPCVVLTGAIVLMLRFGASPVVESALTRSGLSAVDTWYGNAGEFTLSAVLWLTSGLFAVWLALIITPPLCAPALEQLVRAEEQHLGAPPRPRLSLWFEWRCGVRAQLVSLVFSVGTWSLLTLLNVLLPALVIVTLPLKVLAVSAALAWSLLDYPLTLRGIPAARRFRLFAAQPLAVVGFGLPFAVLFWCPCTSVVLLPVGAIAATRVVWLLAERNVTWRTILNPAHAPLDGASSPPNG